MPLVLRRRIHASAVVRKRLCVSQRLLSEELRGRSSIANSSASRKNLRSHAKFANLGVALCISPSSWLLRRWKAGDKQRIESRMCIFPFDGNPILTRNNNMPDSCAKRGQRTEWEPWRPFDKVQAWEILTQQSPEIALKFRSPF